MRARSRRLAAACGAVWLLAGCTTPPMPAPLTVAPLPQQYTCAESRQAGVELRTLPVDAMLRRYMDDYGAVRRRLRALHNLPAPEPCPSP